MYYRQVQGAGGVAVVHYTVTVHSDVYVHVFLDFIFDLNETLK